MIDGEGQLGDANLRKRVEAVENHYKWVEAAKDPGCHSIRVNEGSKLDEYAGVKATKALLERVCSERG